LSSKVNVRQRITELQTTLAMESMTAATLTNDWIIERLIENATEALKAGQRAPANTALMLLGNTRRLFVTVSESTVNRGDAATTSLEGLNARLKELESERDQDATGRGPVPDEGAQRPSDVRFKH